MTNKDKEQIEIFKEKVESLEWSFSIFRSDFSSYKSKKQTLIDKVEYFAWDIEKNGLEKVRMSAFNRSTLKSVTEDLLREIKEW